MPRNYNNFMRALLTDEPGEPTLFEPFIDTWIAEQLIWRRGVHLWDTPECYIDTLVSLGERTFTDVIIADTRLFSKSNALLEQLFSSIVKFADDKLSFVCICDDANSAEYIDHCDGVCASAVYGSIKTQKPMIKMDGTPEAAVKQGCAGWFAQSDAEKYCEKYSDQIAILGGFGVQSLISTGPVSIHKRCENMFETTQNKKFAIGSGGTVPRENYLELISLLGIYKRFKL